jgi:hypothetical protein
MKECDAPKSNSTIAADMKKCSGHLPCSTAHHHHHPCLTSDVKHMLRHLHCTQKHLLHPSSIASAIHEDGQRTAVEATTRARSLPLLADLATMNSRNSARREEGEQLRPLGLPGCPSRAFALCIAATTHLIAAKRDHQATIAVGSGEEGRSGEGVATEAIRPSRPPLHAPPLTSTSADQRRRIQPLAWPELAALHRPPTGSGCPRH